MFLFHLDDKRVTALPQNGTSVDAENEKFINFDHSFTLHDAVKRGKHCSIHCCVSYFDFWFCIGHKHVTEILLKNGANINAKDDDEKSPLKLAAENGKILLKNMKNL